MAPETIGRERMVAQDAEGQRLRDQLKAQIDKGWWLHAEQGVSVGYRYPQSGINIQDDDTEEPQWDRVKIVPTTWPGSRAPHVFLSDRCTSIFDHYGPGFTIVDFTASGEASSIFVDVARSLAAPLKKVHLPAETHCRKIWERDLVLVRPDGYVAWRCSSKTPDSDSLDGNRIRDILLYVLGRGV